MASQHSSAPTASPHGTRRQQPDLQVALAAMPWPLFNRPSIQLAALKAYLAREAGDWLGVDLFHPYLAVARCLGPDRYHWLSRHLWVCEALYAPLLFPEKTAAADKLIRQTLARADEKIDLDGREIRETLDRHLEQWLTATDWHRYGLVGFSICFNQLFSTLAAVTRLKDRFPEVPIAIGGSFCAPAVAASLQRAFPVIDYAVCGEGERPLLELCRFLTGRQASLPPPVLGGEQEQTPHFQQIARLDELPSPDYRDYFQEMHAELTGEPFIPVVPVEFSRGCWWGKCAFCNLNLQWCGYRAKTGARLAQEVLALSSRFGVLDFAFTDNALPPEEARAFFQGLAEKELDLRFFGEIRVHHRPQELAIYRRGGLETVQVGIEALSRSLLRRMNKGASVLDNMAAMKNCLASGMVVEGNLITEFPGSTEEEVEETLRHLDFVLPFPPLATARFFLGHGSPVAQDPGRFGIRAVTRHPRYARLLPDGMRSGLTLLIEDYRGDRAIQRRRWAPVAHQVKAWQEFHRRRPASVRERPALGYRDGGDFLLIRQERPNDRALHHRLRGLSRKIVLACEEPRPLTELQEQFPTLAAAKLRRFLAEMIAKRIMFGEDDRYLTLAVRDRARVCR